MHDLSFASAITGGQPRGRETFILRLRMLPFSVGHELLLLNQQNPLLFDRESFNKLPFAQQKLSIHRAALVCYRTWNENKRPERWIRVWRWFIRKSNWASEIVEFRNYREVGSAFPTVPTQDVYELANGDDKEPRGRELGGPYFARLLTFLSRGGLYRALGYETPYDVPFGMANHIYLSDLEVEGAARIENSREAVVSDEMIEHKREIELENVAAREAWSTATTPEEKMIAVRSQPRILALFQEAAELLQPIWLSAKDDQERHELVTLLPAIMDVCPESKLFLIRPTEEEAECHL